MFEDLRLTIDYWPIDKLLPYARNPRKNDHAVEKAASWIREFGFRVPILAKSDGTIVDGHLRLKAAKKLGLKELPVTIADDMTKVQIKAFRLSVNRMSELAEWDDDFLKIELEELDNLQYDISSLDFPDIQITNQDGGTDGLTDPDEVPEVPQNVFGVKRGDVWLLGNHRIMCGDSTSEDDVKKLMNGKKADMVFTDPPYNVAYGASKNPIWGKKWNGVQKDGVIKNDKHDDEGWINFCSDIAATLNKITEGPIYACHAPGPDGMKMTLVFIGCGIHWSSTIILNKSHLVPGRSDYQKKYEGCFYGWNEKTKIKHLEDRTQTDVWDYKRSTNNDVHPTMKPIEIMEKAFSHHPSCKTVADIFCGSGSTLITAEKTGRTCYGCELDEHYCSVIIKRYIDFVGTSDEVYLVENGEKIRLSEVQKMRKIIC